MSFFSRLLGREEQPQQQVQQAALPVRQAQPQQQLRVQQSSPQFTQPYGQSTEDEYTPNAALEQTGYFSPQTTQHGLFRQGNPYSTQQVQTQSDNQYEALRKLLRF